MGTTREFTGAEIANQLVAMFHFLKALGYDTENLTIEEAFALKSGLTEVLKTSEVLNK